VSFGIVLLAVAVVAILASIWITSERPTKDAAQQELASEAERPRGDDEPNRPSADFAALIHAIADEGGANRAEEKREDRGKKFRDWIIVTLLIATIAGIYWQIYEMNKVYGPIKEQADAAKAAAGAARDNVVFANRAWIEMDHASIEPLVYGAGLHATIAYANIGHQPAKVAQGMIYETFTKEEWAPTLAGAFIREISNECMSTANVTPKIIVFPSQPHELSQDSSSDKLPQAKRVYVDSKIVGGDTFVAVMGCFVYLSFGTVRHTAFCFYYNAAVSTDIDHLSACEDGNDAD